MNLRDGALGDLGARVVSGVLMALAALAAAWIGGPLLFLFWLIAAAGVFVEWWRMTGGAIGWKFAGLIYAGIVLLSPVVLRADPVAGLAALLWLFAVVWGSDILAYVCGRLIGGPRLCPRISPKKTWSGFIGGTLFGGMAGMAVAAAFGMPSLAPVLLVGIIAAIVSQMGDLFESALKRNFSVKDSGSIIPGHGGLMDRLDGFVAAGAFALILGIARAGWMEAGQGVLMW